MKTPNDTQSEDEYFEGDDIQETLYLLSIPGMKESILAASEEPLENYVAKLDW